MLTTVVHSMILQRPIYEAGIHLAQLSRSEECQACIKGLEQSSHPFPQLLISAREISQILSPSLVSNQSQHVRSQSQPHLVTQSQRGGQVRSGQIASDQVSGYWKNNSLNGDNNHNGNNTTRNLGDDIPHTNTSSDSELPANRSGSVRGWQRGTVTFDGGWKRQITADGNQTIATGLGNVSTFHSSERAWNGMDRDGSNEGKGKEISRESNGSAEGEGATAGEEKSLREDMDVVLGLPLYV